MSGLTVLAIQVFAILLAVAALAFVLGRSTVRRVAEAPPVRDFTPPVPVVEPAQAAADPDAATEADLEPSVDLEPDADLDPEVAASEAEGATESDEDAVPAAEDNPDLTVRRSRPTPPLAVPAEVDPAPALITEIPAELAPAVIRPDRESPVFDAVLALRQGLEEVEESGAERADEAAVAAEAADGASVEEIIKAKDAEIGRLESGALAALERTISRFQGQVDDLKEQLQQAKVHGRDLDLRVEEEARRAGRLETALTQRDEALAGLREELDARS